MALTVNAGDAAVKSTAQPAAAVSGQIRRASRQTRSSVAPPSSGFKSQGQPSSTNGVSRSANPGQYEESIAPDGAASMNQRMGGTSLGTSSDGTRPASLPRAKARAWNSGAYSSIESGWARYTRRAAAASTSVAAALNGRGSAASRETSSRSGNCSPRA